MAIIRPEYYGEDIRFVLTGFKQKMPIKKLVRRGAEILIAGNLRQSAATFCSSY